MLFMASSYSKMYCSLCVCVFFQSVSVLLKDRVSFLCFSHRVWSSILHLFYVITWFLCLRICCFSNYNIFSFPATSSQPIYLSEFHSRPEFLIKHFHYYTPGTSFFAELLLHFLNSLAPGCTAYAFLDVKEENVLRWKYIVKEF